MSWLKFLEGPKAVLVLILTTIGTTITVIAWFNQNYVAIPVYETLKNQFEDHVANEKEDSEDVEITINKIRQEIKRVRTDELLFKKKLLLAKGDAQLTEYDRTVIQLIDLELQIYIGTNNTQ